MGRFYFCFMLFPISFSPCCELSQTVILICVPLNDEEIWGFLSIHAELSDSILDRWCQINARDAILLFWQ